MLSVLKEKVCAVVIGGYVNGYSIIQELSSFGVKNIILLHFGNQLACLSNKIIKKISVSLSEESIKEAFESIHKEYEFIIPFPTDDYSLECLYNLREKIGFFTFLPLNQNNFLDCEDKLFQYECCKKLKIPYPKTLKIASVNDLSMLDEIGYPIIIKPYKRLDIVSDVFHALILNTNEDLDKNRQKICKYLNENVKFLASEIIPGETTGTIYAYCGYRSHKGKILNEWSGKKLTQYPDDYGVFSSASNFAPDIITTYGQILLNGMNLYGFAEPEFKYDERDGKYKLMEINLRPMMWNRLGFYSGVPLLYTQWLDALNEIPVSYSQIKDYDIHFCYKKHEIFNLLFRKGYGMGKYNFNLHGGKENYIALFDKKDLKPFLFDSCSTFIDIVKVLIKKILRNIIYR